MARRMPPPPPTIADLDDARMAAPTATVRHARRSTGMPWTPAEDAMALRMRAAGMLLTDIAAAIPGRTSESVRQRLRSLRPTRRSWRSRIRAAVLALLGR